MTMDEDSVDELPERTKRECVFDLVLQGRAVRAGAKEVLVAPAPERTTLHLVDESGGRVELDDLRCQTPRDPEVTSLPGDGVTRPHQSAGHTGDCALPG